MSGPGKKGTGGPQSAAEWISLSIALIILSGFVAAILWLWINQPTGPPQFKVERGLIHNEAGLFHLPVTITNTGGLAVGQVRVQGKLNNEGREEITVTTIDFLPVRAQEEVVMIFSSEPSAAVVQVVSYRLP
jgi:uncharacterized protein (TIGR02588 family)